MFPAALQDLRPKKITNVNTSRNLVEVVRSVFFRASWIFFSCRQCCGSGSALKKGARIRISMDRCGFGLLLRDKHEEEDEDEKKDEEEDE